MSAVRWFTRVAVDLRDAMYGALLLRLQPCFGQVKQEGRREETSPQDYWSGPSGILPMHTKHPYREGGGGKGRSRK